MTVTPHAVHEPHLMTVAEVADLAGVTVRTVRRWINMHNAAVQYKQEPTERGNTVRVALVDPLELAAELPERVAEAIEKDRDATAAGPLDPLQAGSFDDALLRLLEVDAGARGELVVAVGEKWRRSRRTVYRRLRELERGRAGALDEVRADAGRPRIPTAAFELVVSGLVSNPPSTSVRMVHRTLLRAAPDVMRYERGGQTVTVSERTVYRIRLALLEHPRTRLLLSDTDARKEWLRVYSGEVTAAHANDLWSIDMTRCDVMVVDPEAGQVFRPRVHAVIDAYSGCIPGLAFSREEDQTQTDLALLRALLPKGGPFAERYPVWGVPKRMYADNGKTYRSGHWGRILGGLGVELVHSRPRVSHTRGAVERWFGSLHNFEKSLPGYVGKDASKRGTEEMRRLQRNTKAWLEHGQDPGWGNRFLTITEYQNAALSWLIAEHHQWLVDGKTRLEHFTSTVPRASLVELDRQELMLLFAQRVERVVDAAGRVRLENRWWTVPDGSLALHQGRRVLVLRDQFDVTGAERRLVAWRDRGGRLEVIGEAVPAPEVAASLEAQEHRRATKAALLEAAQAQKAMRKDLTDPNVRVATQLLKELNVAAAPELPAAARGRIEAVNPVDPREELEANGDELLAFIRSGRAFLGDDAQALGRRPAGGDAARPGREGEG